MNPENESKKQRVNPDAGNNRTAKRGVTSGSNVSPGSGGVPLVEPQTSAGAGPLSPVSLPPCRRCGVCCREEVCPLGFAVFGPETAIPCPGLVQRGDVAACGVLEAAREAFGADLVAQLEFIMGIGIGCDSGPEDMGVMTLFALLVPYRGETLNGEIKGEPVAIPISFRTLKDGDEQQKIEGDVAP